MMFSHSTSYHKSPGPNPLSPTLRLRSLPTPVNSGFTAPQTPAGSHSKFPENLGTSLPRTLDGFFSSTGLSFFGFPKQLPLGMGLQQFRGGCWRVVLGVCGPNTGLTSASGAELSHNFKGCPISCWVTPLSYHRGRAGIIVDNLRDIHM